MKVTNDQLFRSVKTAGFSSHFSSVEGVNVKDDLVSFTCLKFSAFYRKNILS